MEFRAPNGMLIYYNSRTGQAQLKTHDAAPALRNQALILDTWNGKSDTDVCGALCAPLAFAFAFALALLCLLCFGMLCVALRSRSTVRSFGCYGVV